MSKLAKIALVGAAGFIAGILLAPKSGKETREEIKRRKLQTLDYMKDKATLVRSNARQAGGQVYESASEEARGFAKSAKKSAATVKAEADALSKEAKTRSAKVVADAKAATKPPKK